MKKKKNRQDLVNQMEEGLDKKLTVQEIERLTDQREINKQ